MLTRSQVIARRNRKEYLAAPCTCFNRPSSFTDGDLPPELLHDILTTQSDLDGKRNEY